MPSLLTDEDKEIVKRQIPKASNKIHAVAIAKLYVAYPNHYKWTDTGLQGAVVLANDLIGNTFWLKLVDMSPQNNGVIWDQEIYDTWSYNQDRTFFHTFELEDCLAGLSFVDEKEAKNFLKKMSDREKNANKATKSNPFGGAAPQIAGSGFRHGILGGFFGGHRHSSAPIQPTPPESPSFVLSPTKNLQSFVGSPSHEKSEFAALDAIDPSWRETWGDDLKQMGITDDLIRDNQDFIADYIKAQQTIQNVSSDNTKSQINNVPRPLPPNSGINPSSGHARGPPPAPPPARRSAARGELHREPTPPRESSPPRDPPTKLFAIPPPLPDAGKFAHVSKQSISKTKTSNSVLSPNPPPRPPKNPIDDYEPGESGSKFGLPPPFSGERPSGPPPIPQRAGVSKLGRGAIPPPPRSREHNSSQSSHQSLDGPPPPLPSKITSTPSIPPSTTRSVIPSSIHDSEKLPESQPITSTPALPTSHAPPPPLPHSSAPLPPPIPSSSSIHPTLLSMSYPSSVSSPPPAPQSNAPPPPSSPLSVVPPPPPPPPPAPPMPPSNSIPPPPPMPPSDSIPPPPPMPPSNSIPPPPPMPSSVIPPAPPMPSAVNAASLPNPSNGISENTVSSSKLPPMTNDRSGLLAGIQKAGGIKALKKVDRSQIRDRSQAIVPGNTETSNTNNGASSVGADSGLAGALAAALNKRKKKVSTSDDEADDDDW